MIFVNSIYELQFYHNNGLPCYCDHIVYASDLMLQGLLNEGNGAYGIQIFVYSADGLTQYEDATTYFQYMFATASNGQDYFTLQLKTFSPAMCLHKCWILRVIVTGLTTPITYFDKYTERYCQSSCCDIPRGITYSQPDISGDSEVIGEIVPDLPPDRPTAECGTFLIRLTSIFQCVDNFGDYYFGEPPTILSGTYLDYQIVNNFKGRIVPRPREIKRDISYNCDLQRSESARQYLLEGYEYFPAWKMVEIENQLHANILNVSDFITQKNYQWDGGAAFDKVSGARDCDEVFKLETTLRDCFIRQIFGCSSNCSTDSQITFIIPGQAQGYFYDENLNVIGDYEDLLTYYASIEGVTVVENIDISSSASCGLYAVFIVDGLGYIPTSFYYSYPTQANRVFGQTGIDISEYCDTQGATCGVPAIGSISYADMDCDAPVIGTVTYSDVEPAECTIEDYGYWNVDNVFSVSSNYLGQVTFDIRTERGTGKVAGQDEEISGEVIGQISAACWPLTRPVVIDSTVNPALPVDTSFIIDTNGFIYFYGSIEIAISYTVTIEYTGLIYNQ